LESFVWLDIVVLTEETMMCADCLLLCAIFRPPPSQMLRLGFA
jgi:hypothetical protein